MINVQIDIPEALAPFVSPTTEQKNSFVTPCLFFLPFRTKPFLMVALPKFSTSKNLT